MYRVYFIGESGGYMNDWYYATDTASAVRQAKAEYGRKIKILEVRVS